MQSLAFWDKSLYNVSNRIMYIRLPPTRKDIDHENHNVQ